MPASVMQRAEKVLIDISYDLRNIQSEAYKTQDRVANQIHEGYKDKKWVLYRKPVLDSLSLGTRIVANYNPAKIMQALGTTDRTEALTLLKNSLDILTSIPVDGSNVAVDANLDKLKSSQGELATFHQSMQSMIQTLDTALQRLQNMEGANRQAG